MIIESINDQITILNRQVQQYRLEYFHCMDFRIYDRAEQILVKIEAIVEEIKTLETL